MSEICSECWLHDCKNCAGGMCWHARQGRHYPEREGEPDPEFVAALRKFMDANDEVLRRLA